MAQNGIDMYVWLEGGWGQLGQTDFPLRLTSILA